MFLTPLEDAGQFSFTTSGSVHKDDPVAIDFLAPIGSESRQFRLHAVVVRAFEGGMGVSFCNPDIAALRGLEGLAHVAALSKTTKQTTGGEALAVLCQNVLEQRLFPLIHSFFERINDRLVKAARGANNNLEQSAHFDAITELEKLRGLIERMFLDALQTGFKRIGHAQYPEQEGLEKTCPTELSLVDKTELEDLLAIGEIIAKAEPRYQSSLEEIEQRFSSSVHAPVDKANNPVGPAAVCHAFRSALRDSVIPPKVMQIVYRVFDECVVGELGGVYDALNTALAANGILPAVASQSDRTRRYPGVSAAGTAAVPSAGDCPESQPGLNAPSPRLAPAQPVQPASERPVPVGETVWSAGAPFEPVTAARAGAPELLPSYPFSYGGAPPLGQRWGTPETARPLASEVGEPGTARRAGGYGTARRLLQLAQGLTSQAFDSSVDSSVLNGSAAATFLSSKSNADIKKAEGVPSRMSPANSVASQQGPEVALKERLFTALQSAHKGVEAGYVPQERLDEVEFLDQVLGAIAGDPLVCDDAKAWLRRLAIPLGHGTIMDGDFLSSQSHPATQMINQIAQIKPALFAEDGKGGAEVIAEVNRIIEQIERQETPSAAVFAAAQDQLAAILARQNERYDANVAQVVKAREEQQAFVKSRQGSGKETSPSGRANPRKVSNEWLGWLAQAKQLRVGDAVTLGVGTQNAHRGKLVWIGDGHNPFVFVDDAGKKLATLSLQELAMQLRRGNLAISAAGSGPVVDKAVYENLRKIHERIEYHATHDSLTGFLNAKEFQRHLEQAALETGEGDRNHALCRLRLQMEQSSLPEEAALVQQALLRGVADALQQALGESAVLARMGDDTFGALLENCGKGDGDRLADELRRIVQPYRLTWRGREIAATGHVDLLPILNERHTVAHLLGSAALGLSSAPDEVKEVGQIDKAASTWSVSPANQGNKPMGVDQAFAEGLLHLSYRRIEPISNTDSQSPYYQVALCLEDDHGNLVPVDDSGRIRFSCKHGGILDRQVIEQVLRWMATHKSDLRGIGSIAISLSIESFADDRFTSFLMEQFTETKVPPAKICFEISEKSMVANLPGVSSFITTTKEFGCRFALDDFGRADTSYSFLKDLPFNYLKIDGNFVKDILESSSDFAVVRSVNEIGHFMGKKTVAKKVGNEQVLQRLQEIGVDYAQGPWIDAKMRAEDRIFGAWNEPLEKPAYAR